MWLKLPLLPLVRRMGAAAVAAACLVGVLSAPASAASVVVRPGDTLIALARSYSTSVAELASLNHLSDPNLILIGATLLVPDAAAGAPVAAGAPAAASSLVVQPGQTLTAIALAHGTTVAAIAAANGIGDANLIYAGQRLSMPAGAELPGTGGWLPGLVLADPARLQLVPAFRQWAAAYHVPATLLEALAWWESGWQSSVVSPTGAIGIGQLEPGTVAIVRDDILHSASLDPVAPKDNIRMSAAFLAYLLSEVGGNESLAVAAYYQGLASLRRWGMLPETRHYVQGILAYARLFSR